MLDWGIADAEKTWNLARGADRSSKNSEYIESFRQVFGYNFVLKGWLGLKQRVILVAFRDNIFNK